MKDPLKKSYVRPVLGWLSVLSIAWNFVIQPIIVLVFSIMGITLVPILMSDAALVALLGVSACTWVMRGYEKIKGVGDK